MEKTNREIERLKSILKNLKDQIPDEKNWHRQFYFTFCAVRGVIRIFAKEDNKEAEEILVELLSHENEGIQFLALCALWDAENRERTLEWKTQIRLDQFRNNPINQRMCCMLDSSFKAEKARLN